MTHFGVCPEPLGIRDHTCAVCGTTAKWGPGWAWLGVFSDARALRGDMRVEATVCSDACRVAWDPGPPVLE